MLFFSFWKYKPKEAKKQYSLQNRKPNLPSESSVNELAFHVTVLISVAYSTGMEQNAQPFDLLKHWIQFIQNCQVNETPLGDLSKVRKHLIYPAGFFEPKATAAMDPEHNLQRAIFFLFSAQLHLLFCNCLWDYEIFKKSFFLLCSSYSSTFCYTENSFFKLPIKYQFISQSHWKFLFQANSKFVPWFHLTVNWVLLSQFKIINRLSSFICFEGSSLRYRAWTNVLNFKLHTLFTGDRNLNLHCVSLDKWPHFLKR